MTYGCIVYQEQVIEIFRTLAGYSMGQADNIRRAISKKKQKIIEAERHVFVYGDQEQGIPGAVARGVPEAVAQSVYDEIVDFGDYAFNKAHSVCYAVVAYQTAYLKYYYPRQYMAALMTSVLDSAGKIAGYIAECKEMEIPVLPPDINHSTDKFTVEPEGIRFGLGAVKNVGRGLIRAMVAKRTSGGPFQSLEDFLQRMEEGDLNKRVVENLIKCGAMDCFGLYRSQLLAMYEPAMEAVADSRRRNVEGQLGMFAMLEEEGPSLGIPVPKMNEISRADRMAMEKETTGLYLSGHPMDDYRPYLKNTHVLPIGSLMDEERTVEDESIVSVAGIIQKVRLKTTRNNSMMAYVTLEDDTGSMELLTFSNVLTQFGSLVQEGAAVVVIGRLSIRDEKDPQVVVNRVRSILDYADGNLPEEGPQPARGGKLYLRLASEAVPEYRKTRAILNMFPGTSSVLLYFADTQVRRGTMCGFQEDMLQELTALLGKENVVLK